MRLGEVKPCLSTPFTFNSNKIPFKWKMKVQILKMTQHRRNDRVRLENHLQSPQQFATEKRERKIIQKFL